MSIFDTIVAPITGHPPAAVAWIRLSGPDSYRIASEIFSPWPSPVVPRLASYGRYASGDDGLALPFEAGHSYTGEQCVELSMHGSYASVRSVIQACLTAGARFAEPGEFTQRAFLNGRIDLTQAEAVRDTVDSLTAIQLRQATRNREGALRREVSGIRSQVLGLLAAVEASVDFSEEIGDVDRLAAMDIVTGLYSRILELLQRAAISRIVRNGYRIVILGPPNAGKSSLLNRLLGAERSIVTDIPGTTRDYVEEKADFDGVPVVLVDTAGLRESADIVEQIGIGRALEQAGQADEVWYVYDGQIGPGSEVEMLERPGICARALANKADLGPTVGSGLPVSATTGHGIAALVDRVREAVLESAPEFAVNERQSRLLDEALTALTELGVALRHDSPDDLLSVLLSELIAILGRITGETAEADMIERIFHDFCVGK